MTTHRHEPVIVGIGELCEPLPGSIDDASSLLDLLERAVGAALEDTGSAAAVVGAIDAIAMVRTFSDSAPMYPNPFGKVKNYPRALAKRIGAEPRHAVYGVVGGNTPQLLVTEFASRVASGEFETVVLTGGEAMATTKAAIKAGAGLDWADDTTGQLDDRGLGMEGMLDRGEIDNGMSSGPLLYGLLENARRHDLGMSREAYADEMAKLFAPFSEVAASHPSAMFPRAYSREELLRVDEANPMIAEPYPKRLVAKDGVNQAAAVVLTSREKAEALGIAAEKMVFPVTGATVREHRLAERPDLGRSEALRLAYSAALDKAGISPGEISTLDLYSCFPIAVFSACDALGLAADDVRGLTLTGGLPFFGGPGNNYAMHSVVNVVRKLRTLDTGFGLVGANGGVLSKHSVGIYSRQPSELGWLPCDDAALQTEVDAIESPEVDHCPNGPATIEAYSVTFRRGEPEAGFVIGRTIEGKRFLGRTDPADLETAREMLVEDPMGRRIHVTHVGPGNRFTFN